MKLIFRDFTISYNNSHKCFLKHNILHKKKSGENSSRQNCEKNSIKIRQKENYRVPFNINPKTYFKITFSILK
jgi:hypothetical protein